MVKQKVVCIVPSLLTGGAEKMALDLVTYLDSKKFDVTLISLFPFQNSIYDNLAKERGFEVYYLNKTLGFDLKTMFELHLTLSKIKPDIIHTHLQVCIYVAPWILLNNNVRWIHTIHNEAAKELPKIHSKIMKKFYKRKRCIPVAISEGIHSSISKFYGLSYNTIPLIHNGIDTKYFAPSSKLKNNSKKVIFTCVARFNSQKNHKLLIEAFSLAVKENSQIFLLLIGDGYLRDEIVEQINLLGIEDHVELVGNTNKVLSYLQESDVFVLSSNYEGLPLSVLEAMSVGLPVISTEVGGIPDVIENEIEGLITKPGEILPLTNSIIKLANDKQLRLNMKVNAQKKAKQFDIRRMALLYGELYRSI